MLTLYGNKQSGSCVKVEYVLRFLDLEFDYKQLDFTKDLKTEWYLKIHPAGKIPALDDHGFILFESGAIARYLCEKHGGKLIPHEVKGRAQMDQWIDFINLHLAPAIGKVAFNRVFAPMMGMPVNEQSIETGMKEIERFMPIIDAQLTHGSHVVGNELSLADIALLAATGYCEMAKIDLIKYTHFMTWLNLMKGQVWYKKVHASS